MKQYLLQTNQQNLLNREVFSALSFQFNFKIGWQILILSVGMLFCMSVDAQISGVAFRDFDGNGMQQAGEPGVSNIVVNFYTNSTPPAQDMYIGQTTTGSDGSYSFNPPVYPVRIEFETPEGFCNLDPDLDFPASNGNLYGTSVQFAESDGTYNYILNYPADFAFEENPLTYTTCFINGDPLAGGNASSSEVLVGMRYNYSGDGSNSGYPGATGPPHDIIGNADQLGSIWGIAISRQAKKIFTASFMKRHTGFGPLGTGGIYAVDIDDYSTLHNYNWLDFDADLGISTSDQVNPYTTALTGPATNTVNFSPVVGTNAERGLSPTKQNPSADPAAYEQVGKISFGDIDISEDGRFLYVVNLYDRTLYQIDLVDPYNPQVPTMADVGTLVKGFPIPNPCSGSQGEHRPFAVKVNRGKVYVGTICSAQDLNSQVVGGIDDLEGTIYEFDMETEVFNGTPVIQFPLNYRESSGQGWRPWKPQFEGGYFEGPGFPMLSDIEFDGGGNMQIALMDRRGHQMGWRNWDLHGNGNFSIAAVGDILKAERDVDAVDCEYSIQFVPEFYKDTYIHLEPVTGGLSVHKTANSDNILATFMDPIQIWSGGTMKFDNKTGNRLNGYTIYYQPGGAATGPLGKAHGIGDIEALQEVPLIEIGNSVWIDKDKDGIQDPDEERIPGVTIELLNSGGTVIASTITDEDGEYYFNYSNVNDPAAGTSGVTGPLPYTDYKLRISPTQFFADQGVDGSPLENLVPTLLNTTGAGQIGLSDNDASVITDTYCINLQTSQAGANDHSLDFGLAPLPDLALTHIVDPSMDYSDLEVGDPIKFKMYVCNQSELYVDSLNVTDYIPDGYAFDGTIIGNEIWTYDAGTNTARASLTDLVGMETDSLCIYLRLVDRDVFEDLINVAEISYAEDINGVSLVNDDIDSVLDDDATNNGGSQFDTPADDYKDGDGTATSIDGIAATDQDNVDPAAVPICDLALTNTIDETQVDYAIGDTIKYIIEVENQGTILAKNIKINYHIPEGLVYIPANDALTPNWMLQGDIAMATITEDLPQDSKDSICIYLTVDHVSMAQDFADAWTTIAEIDSYTDRDLNIKGDLDSTPDADPTNDSGGNPDDDTDDVTTGNGTGDPDDPIEDSDPLLDEDDHDPAIIYVCDAATIIYTDHDEPIRYGDTIKYNIVVFNQGNGPITNIAINDFHNGGFEYISTPVNDAANWSSAVNTVSTTITDVILPGESDTTCLELVIGDWIPFDEDAYLQTVEIESFEDPAAPGVSKVDIDSTPDNNPDNDSGANPLDDTDDEIEGDGSGDPDNPTEDTDPELDEDDHDAVMIYVFDLALQKVVMDDRVYSPGEKPVFEITVHNQGNMAAMNYQIIDYLSPGFSFSTMNNPGWSTYGDDLVYTSSGTLEPGESEVVTLELTVVIPTNPIGVQDWWNYAEIMNNDDDVDAGNADPVDADSDPNDDKFDDNLVVPDDEDDNVITENGFVGGDEDDADPAKVIVGYDLALSKTVKPAIGPYFHGDTLTYTLTIFNQGGLAVSDIEIYDSIPCGLLFLEDENDDWDLDGNKAETTIEEVLIPGQMTTTEIKLVVQQCENPDYNSYYNIAEISDFADENGDEPLTDDIDSTPDEDPYNDGDPIDNATEDPMDQDDHDIEDIIVCDLALKNSVVDIEEEVKVGDTIKFEVVVFNQGNRDVNSAFIDYTIPNGFAYLPINSGLSPMWNEESGVLASVETDNILAPNESDTVCIYLQIEHLPTDEVTMDSWTTVAEVTSYTDDNGDLKNTDADSTPDDDPSNDPGGNPGDDTDDEIGGNGNGDPNDPMEDTDPSLDEDDHDPAIVYVCDIASFVYSELPDEINYFDTLKYNIVVMNQGNGPITNILIADHIPDGFEFVETTLNDEEGWTESEDIDDAIQLVYEEVLATGETDTICLELQIVPVHGGSDESSWLQIVEVVQFEDPANPDEPKADIDSTPDDDPDNDPGGNPDDETDDVTDGDGTGDPDDKVEDADPMLDEDDNDPVDTKVFDCALIMQIDSMPPVLPVVPGDILKFIIEVTNQGNTPATDVEVTNYLMDENLELANVPGNSDWNDIDSEINKYTYDEVILPGEKDTVCIYLEVIGGAMTDIVTYAEISGSAETDGDCYDIDSTPDDELEGDAGGTPESEEDDHIEDDGEDGNQDGITDEDDHDPAMLDGQDLALIIWADQKEPVVEGQDVKFIIRVTNQGNITNENIKIVNYLPAGFELSENDDNGWEYDPMNDDQVTKTLDESLAMDEVVETCIVLTVQEGTNALDLVNYTEIVSSNDPDGLDLTELDIDSSPNNIDDDDTGGQFEDMPDCSTDPVIINDDNFVGGAGVNGEDEDDHDPAWVHVFDLASIIYTDRTTPIIPGDEVKFNVEVHNQGNMSATDIDLLLQVPDGFILSPNDDNDWDTEDGMLSNTYEDDLIPNQIDTICLLLEVLPDFTLNNLIPIVEITGAMDTLGNERNDFDLDSNPNSSPDDDAGGEIFTEDDDSVDGNGEEGNDEDDHDPAVPPVMDLAIKIVTVDETPKMPGDIVKFAITLYNQGSMVPSEFTIEDYIPEGLGFVDNVDNDGWVPTGDGNATYVYDEDLLPLTEDTICIFLEVLPGANPKNVVNMVEIIQIIDQLDNDVSLLDIDSESDNSNENDKGNDLYSPEDNKTEENGRSGDDEDDHDQAFVNMCAGISCNGHMNISVDQNCEAVITPSVVLTGDIFPDHVYDVVITNSDDEVVSNMFGGEDVGETFTVSVTNPLCNDNSCWMTILIEDKWAPQIICQDDTVSCVLAFDESIKPTLIDDNCSGGELILLDEQIETLSCDSLFTARMNRVWIAVDEAGNYSDTCTQVISVLRTNLDSIMPVQNFMLATNNAISCSSGYATDENGHPAPSVTGVPKLRVEDGSFIDLYPFDASQICNGYVEYEDEVLFGSTDCVTKIMRTWNIGEWWCSQTNEREFVQLIEVVDFEGPSVSCPADMTISTSSYSCEGVLSVPLPTVSDACSGTNIRIDLSVPESPSGFMKDYNGSPIILPVGVNEVTYHVYDDCDNRTDCTFRVTVRDDADPIAICDQFTAIGFGLEELTKVTAESIDDGSFDECGDVILSVARMDDPGFEDFTGFGPDVDITCEDVGTNVMVGLLVTDAGGNTNMCMVSIEVQDKIDAQFLCPDDVTVECNFPFDPDNLGAFFGEVEIFDNCPSSNTVDNRLIGELNECGAGVLIREIRLINAQGVEVDFCTQEITFERGETLQFSDITPPPSEVTVTGCGIESIDPSILGMPIVPDDECQLVGIAVENDTFPFTENGACLKILRTFRVVDWCMEDGPGSVLEPFEFLQTIKVNNTEGPEFEEVFEDSVICSYAVDCGGLNIDGYLIATASDDCTATSDLLNRYEVRDSEGELYRTGAGLDASGFYDVDVYEVRFISEDKCGNQTIAESGFEVRSCKLPTPYCLQGLSTTLTAMDTTGDGSADVEMVMLPADYFNAGSYHPCGYDIQLSFSADVNDTIMTFFCSDTVGLQEIELWVTDENGGQDYCTTFIDIQDNDTIDLCGGLKPVEIAGRVYTEMDIELRETEVELRSTESIVTMTNEEGWYAFADMPTGGDYQLSPYKDDDHLNGVSTLDLVMIQRHLLGIAPLNSVYKLIAADINNNEKITASDLVALRKVILGIESEFVNNTSWRFIDSEYAFMDEQNPWTTEIGEYYNIYNLSEDMKVDFIAVKTGDVNDNVDVNVASGVVAETRSEEILKLELSTAEIVEGQIYEIAVKSGNEDKTDFYGMQYTFDLMGLEVVNVLPGALKVSSEHIHVEEDRMHLSYASGEGHELAKGDVLYTLVLKAREDGGLSEKLRLSKGGLSAELYHGVGLKTGIVEIEWNSAGSLEVTEAMMLEGNKPNPWINSTEIEFYLPSEGEVQLIVKDANGRLILNRKDVLTAGRQSMVVSAADVDVTGVFIYELHFANQIHQGKMIRLK